MVDTAFQVAGTFTARQGRQAQSVVMAGATAARPLGALTGVRPGTSPTTVSATSTTVTVGPFAGIIDAQTAAEAGPYEFAFDAITTMALTAADPSNPRSDIVFARINDTAEDGGGATNAVRVYQAGAAGVGAPIPVPSVSPVTRALVIAVINVPKAGGGSPTVTWVAPYTVAAGGVLPIDTLAHLNLIAGSLGQHATVYADGANNGDYAWLGAGWVGLGVWVAWVTSWTALNTAPSVGNGTLVAEFAWMGGNTYAIRITLVTGSTTNGGTGAWRFTLPPGILPAAGAEQILPCKGFTATNASSYMGAALLTPGSSSIQPYLPASGTAVGMQPVRNADASAANSTGVPLVSGNFSFTSGSNLTIEGIFHTA